MRRNATETELSLAATSVPILHCTTFTIYEAKDFDINKGRVIITKGRRGYFHDIYVYQICLSKMDGTISRQKSAASGEMREKLVASKLDLFFLGSKYDCL